MHYLHITKENIDKEHICCAMFRDGKFLTQSIQSDKKFLTLAGIQDQVTAI